MRIFAAQNERLNIISFPSYFFFVQRLLYVGMLVPEFDKRVPRYLEMPANICDRFILPQHFNNV